MFLAQNYCVTSLTRLYLCCVIVSYTFGKVYFRKVLIRYCEQQDNMQRIRIKQYLYMLITCNKQINSVWSLFCALAPAFMCSDLLSNGCMVNMAGDVNAGNYENRMCISYLDIHFKITGRFILTGRINWKSTAWLQ